MPPRLTFGVYNGMCCGDLINRDPNYIRWLSGENANFRQRKWLQENHMEVMEWAKSVSSEVEEVEHRKRDESYKGFYGLPRYTA